MLSARLAELAEADVVARDQARHYRLTGRGRELARHPLSSSTGGRSRARVCSLSVNAPELSVVCKSCGSEVSPYVTECPYCGTRLRKRAPKLERHGDELQAAGARAAGAGGRSARARAARSTCERPTRVIAAVVGRRCCSWSCGRSATPVTTFGAIVGDVGSEWWRYLAAPFVYPDVGYLFVIGVGVMIFGPPVERRLGTIPTAGPDIACGALGMLAAEGIEGALGAERACCSRRAATASPSALLCAWAVLQGRRVRAEPDERRIDVIGVAVRAVVLLLLPLVEDFANVFAGLGGAAGRRRLRLGRGLARRHGAPAG